MLIPARIPLKPGCSSLAQASKQGGVSLGWRNNGGLASAWEPRSFSMDCILRWRSALKCAGWVNPGGESDEEASVEGGSEASASDVS